MSCGVGHRHGSDQALLWLWCRLVSAAAIWPLSWELPHVMGGALKKTKREKKKAQSQPITDTQIGFLLPCVSTWSKSVSSSCQRSTSNHFWFGTAWFEWIFCLNKLLKIFKCFALSFNRRHWKTMCLVRFSWSFSPSPEIFYVVDSQHV